MNTNADLDPEIITDETAAEIRERLEEHRDLLERLAELDVPASEDAERALAFLDGNGGGQS